MTSTVDTDGPPRAAALWRSARLPVIVGALVLVAGVLVALLGRQAPSGLLDPTAVDGAGSRALVELLRAQDVTVRDVRTHEDALAAAGPGSTVLVAFPQRLPADRLASLRGTGADLVLVEPGPRAVGALAPDVQDSGSAAIRARAPRCDLAAARAAGTVEIGGDLYVGGDESCYPTTGGAPLVQAAEGGRTVTLLGTGDVLTNDELTTEGTAALGMRLLGANEELVWYLPPVQGPPPGAARPLGELVPSPWYWALGQTVLAVLLVVVWRARRLGRVVTEPLPVVVRAAETVEGRARLYARANDRGHAAEALREATRARLRPLLGQVGSGVDGSTMDSGALVDAAAARTGRAPGVVGTLLYGPAPGDDAALVELAGGLDALEREVRRS